MPHFSCSAAPLSPLVRPDKGLEDLAAGHEVTIRWSSYLNKIQCILGVTPVHVHDRSHEARTSLTYNGVHGVPLFLTAIILLHAALNRVSNGSVNRALGILFLGLSWADFYRHCNMKHLDTALAGSQSYKSQHFWFGCIMILWPVQVQAMHIYQHPKGSKNDVAIRQHLGPGTVSEPYV